MSKKNLLGVLLIFILLLGGGVWAESEQELREQFNRNPSPQNLLQLGDKATLSDFGKLTSDQQGTYLTQRYTEEFAREYYHAPESVGKSPEVDLKYFTNVDNVGKNPESDKKFFSGSYVTNSREKSRDNFRAAKDSGSRFLSLNYGANYVIEAVDESFAYDAEKGTLTNGKKTIPFSLFKDVTNVKRIRTVDQGIIIEKEFEKITKLVGDGELELTSFSLEKGNYQFKRGGEIHQVTQSDKEDLVIESTADGGITITGKAVGSSQIGKSTYRYENRAGTLTIFGNGEVKADNAKLNTPSLYLEGRFQTKFNQDKQLDLALFSYDGKDSTFVDKNSLIGVKSQGQSREKGESVIIHMAQTNPQSIYEKNEPTQTQVQAAAQAAQAATSSNNAEVWIKKEGAELKVYARGKVEVSGYLTTVRTSGQAVKDHRTFSFVGKTGSSSFDRYDKAGWDQFEMKGASLYEDAHTKTDMVAEGAIVNKLAPTTNPSNLDLLRVNCPSCGEGQDIGSITKKLLSIKNERVSYDVPVTDPATGTITTRKVEVLTPIDSSTGLVFNLHKEKGQVVPLIDQTSAGTLAQQQGRDSSFALERSLLLVNGEGDQKNFFGIYGNAIGSFEVKDGGKLEATKVAFNFNGRSLTGNEIIVDEKSSNNVKQFLELWSNRDYEGMRRLSDSGLDEKSKRLIQENTGIDVTTLTNPKYLEALQRATTIQDTKVKSRISAIQRSFGITLDGSGRCVAPDNCNEKLQTALRYGNALAQHYLSLLSDVADSRIAALEAEEEAGIEHQKDIRGLKEEKQRYIKQKNAWNNFYAATLEKKKIDAERERYQQQVAQQEATAYSYANPDFSTEQDQLSLTEASEIGHRNNALEVTIRNREDAIAEYQRKREAEIDSAYASLNAPSSDEASLYINEPISRDVAAAGVDQRKNSYLSLIAKAKAEKEDAQKELDRNRGYLGLLAETQDNPGNKAAIYREGGDYQNAAAYEEMTLDTIRNQPPEVKVDETPVLQRLTNDYVHSGEYDKAQSAAVQLSPWALDEVNQLQKQEQIGVVTGDILVPAINQQVKVHRENEREREDAGSISSWAAEILTGPVSALSKAGYTLSGMNEEERKMSEYRLGGQVTEANRIVQELASGKDIRDIKSNRYSAQLSLIAKTSTGQKVNPEEEGQAKLEEAKNKEELGLRRDRGSLEDEYKNLALLYPFLQTEAQARADEVNSWDLQDVSEAGGIAGDIVLPIAGGIGAGVKGTSTVVKAVSKGISLVYEMGDPLGIAKVGGGRLLGRVLTKSDGAVAKFLMRDVREVFGRKIEREVTEVGESALVHSVNPEAHDTRMLEHSYDGEYYNPTKVEEVPSSVPSATEADYQKALGGPVEGQGVETPLTQEPTSEFELPTSATEAEYEKALGGETSLPTHENAQIIPQEEIPTQKIPPITEDTSTLKPENLVSDNARVNAQNTLLAQREVEVPSAYDSLQSEIFRVKADLTLSPAEKVEVLAKARTFVESPDAKGIFPEAQRAELLAVIDTPMSDDVAREVREAPIPQPEEVVDDLVPVEKNLGEKQPLTQKVVEDWNGLSGKKSVPEVATVSRRERLQQQFYAQPFDEDKAVQRFITDVREGDSLLDSKTVARLLKESPETIERVKSRVKLALLQEDGASKVEKFESWFNANIRLQGSGSEYMPVFEVEDVIKRSDDLSLSNTEKRAQGVLLERGKYLIAQGVEEEKGGITGLINIQLEGEVRFGYEGKLELADPSFSAGQHGPYYVIFDRDSAVKVKSVFHSDSEIVAFVVPGEKHRRVITEALEEAVGKGLITPAERESILKRVITYEEMNKLPESALNSGDSLREAINVKSSSQSFSATSLPCPIAGAAAGPCNLVDIGGLRYKSNPDGSWTKLSTGEIVVPEKARLLSIVAEKGEITYDVASRTWRSASGELSRTEVITLEATRINVPESVVQHSTDSSLISLSKEGLIRPSDYEQSTRLLIDKITKESELTPGQIKELVLLRGKAEGMSSKELEALSGELDQKIADALEATPQMPLFAKKLIETAPPGKKVTLVNFYRDAGPLSITETEVLRLNPNSDISIRSIFVSRDTLSVTPLREEMLTVIREGRAKGLNPEEIKTELDGVLYDLSYDGFIGEKEAEAISASGYKEYFDLVDTGVHQAVPSDTQGLAVMGSLVGRVDYEFGIKEVAKAKEAVLKEGRFFSEPQFLAGYHQSDPANFYPALFEKFEQKITSDPNFKQMVIDNLRYLYQQGLLEEGTHLRFVDTCCVGTANLFEEATLNHYNLHYEEIDKLLGRTRTGSFTPIETSSMLMRSNLPVLDSGLPHATALNTEYALTKGVEFSGKFSGSEPLFKIKSPQEATLSYLDELVVVKQARDTEKLGSAARFNNVHEQIIAGKTYTVKNGRWVDQVGQEPDMDTLLKIMDNGGEDTDQFDKLLYQKHSLGGESLSAKSLPCPIAGAAAGPCNLVDIGGLRYKSNPDGSWTKLSTGEIVVPEKARLLDQVAERGEITLSEGGSQIRIGGDVPEVYTQTSGKWVSDTGKTADAETAQLLDDFASGNLNSFTPEAERLRANMVLFKSDSLDAIESRVKYYTFIGDEEGMRIQRLKLSGQVGAKDVNQVKLREILQSPEGKVLFKDAESFRLQAVADTYVFKGDYLEPVVLEDILNSEDPVAALKAHLEYYAYTADRRKIGSLGITIEGENLDSEIKELMLKEITSAKNKEFVAEVRSFSAIKNEEGLSNLRAEFKSNLRSSIEKGNKAELIQARTFLESEEGRILYAGKDEERLALISDSSRSSGLEGVITKESVDAQGIIERPLLTDSAEEVPLLEMETTKTQITRTSSTLEDRVVNKELIEPELTTVLEKPAIERYQPINVVDEYADSKAVASPKVIASTGSGSFGQDWLIKDKESGKMFFVTKKGVKENQMASKLGNMLKGKAGGEIDSKIYFPEMRRENFGQGDVVLSEYAEDAREMISAELSPEVGAFATAENIWIRNWDFRAGTSGNVLVAKDGRMVPIDFEKAFGGDLEAGIITTTGGASIDEKVLNVLAERANPYYKAASPQDYEKAFQIIENLGEDDYAKIRQFALDSGYSPSEAERIVVELKQRAKTIREDVNYVIEQAKVRQVEIPEWAMAGG